MFRYLPDSILVIAGHFYLS